MIDMTHNKIILFVGLAVAGVGLLGAGTLTHLYLEGHHERRPRIMERGTLTASLAATTLVHTDVDGEPYTPTSQYVEPGADSDEVTLGFAPGEQPEPQGDMLARLDDVEVQETIGDNQNDLITCYAEALGRNEALRGRVDFHFRVASDGHVAMVKVLRSELADQETEDCFVEAAASWKFPRTQSAQLLKFDTDFLFAY